MGEGAKNTGHRAALVLAHRPPPPEGAFRFPLPGTHAGMILLARDIRGSSQPRLGLMDISVQRNGFGRQRDSFEIDLDIRALGNRPFRAVFIRAPYASAAGPDVEVLATLGDRIVLCHQGSLLACAFHPELTDDPRVHRYFLNLVTANR